MWDTPAEVSLERMWTLKRMLREEVIVWQVPLGLTGDRFVGTLSLVKRQDTPVARTPTRSPIARSQHIIRYRHEIKRRRKYTQHIHTRAPDDPSSLELGTKETHH